MIIYLILLAAGLFLAGGILEGMLDAERESRVTRPLTQDERAAWGRYRLEDRAKVARMAATRAQDRAQWECVGLPAARAESARKDSARNR